MQQSCASVAGDASRCQPRARVLWSPAEVSGWLRGTGSEGHPGPSEGLCYWDECIVLQWCPSCHVINQWDPRASAITQRSRLHPPKYLIQGKHLRVFKMSPGSFLLPADLCREDVCASWLWAAGMQRTQVAQTQVSAYVHQSQPWSIIQSLGVSVLLEGAVILWTLLVRL